MKSKESSSPFPLQMGDKMQKVTAREGMFNYELGIDKNE